MRIAIGPVDAAAARAWTAHLRGNLATLRGRRHLLPFRLPDEVADDFEALLTEWSNRAAEGGVFTWSDHIEDGRALRLVQYWANLDSLTDAQVRSLGLDWAPAEARPFFDALAHAVADAIASAAGDGGAPGFAELLVDHGRRPVRSVHEAAGPACDGGRTRTGAARGAG